MRKLLRAASDSREIVPSLIFAMFTFFASEDLRWSLAAAYGALLVLSRFEDAIEAARE